MMSSESCKFYKQQRFIEPEISGWSAPTVRLAGFTEEGLLELWFQAAIRNVLNMENIFKANMIDMGGL